MGDNLNAVYVTKPRNYQIENKYPVLFFAHGAMGSWELYTGITNQLNSCFIVHIGTTGLNVFFSSKDIEKCFSVYLPYLKSRGYHIDENRLYLAGLSNGGTASELALKEYDDRFEGVAYISTPCNTWKRTKAKVLLIGGGKDHSASNLPTSYKQMKAAGTNVALYWADNENHFLFANKSREVMSFIEKEFNL